MSCKIISIVNQKGGVGKTTTAGNLATALAAVGKQVLLIDNDPQGNTTSGFGLNKKNSDTLYHVMLKNICISKTILETSIPKLSIVPSDINLAAVEIELATQRNIRTILKEVLKDITIKYDYIIIDCPPALGLLTINALVASSSILIPLQCEFFALEGLKHLMETVKLVKNNLNNNLKINGILLTMYDRRNNLTKIVETDVRSCLGTMVYETVIPRNVKLSEASSHGKPILLYDRSCVGAVAYINMAKEFLKREQINQRIAT
ncbi:MAG: ParA family protein [Rickettsiales bacterium]|nr:ParA family protein [Rickettsiales bacterium]